MADTFAFSDDLAFIADLNQLPPNPSLKDEEGITTAALLPTLGGFPGGPCVVAAAPWALYNSARSGKLVRLLSLSLTEFQARTATATSNRLNTIRTSAQSGGIAVASIKLDTAAADLPSQVLIAEGPDITTAGAVLRTALDLPQLNPTRAVAYPPWRTPGTADRIYAQAGADVQGQVLREGQGLAVFATGRVAKENWPLAVVVVFTVGADTYMLRSRVTTGSMDCAIGLFNGSGSGVVITVRGVYATEVATDEQLLRRFQLEPISGLRGGVSLDTVTGLDSTAALPSSILCVEKAGCLQESADAIDPPARPCENVLRRLVCPSFGASPGIANTCLFPGAQRRVFDQNSDSPIVLREGEGVALFQRQVQTGWAFGYHISGLFTVEDATTQGIVPVIGGGLVRAA